MFFFITNHVNTHDTYRYGDDGRMNDDVYIRRCIFEKKTISIEHIARWLSRGYVERTQTL